MAVGIEPDPLAITSTPAQPLGYFFVLADPLFSEVRARPVLAHIALTPALIYEVLTINYTFLWTPFILISVLINLSISLLQSVFVLSVPFPVIFSNTVTTLNKIKTGREAAMNE